MGFLSRFDLFRDKGLKLLAPEVSEGDMRLPFRTIAVNFQDTHHFHLLLSSKENKS